VNEVVGEIFLGRGKVKWRSREGREKDEGVGR
jgi:hypothetical protein